MAQILHFRPMVDGVVDQKQTHFEKFLIILVISGTATAVAVGALLISYFAVAGSSGLFKLTLYCVLTMLVLVPVFGFGITGGNHRLFAHASYKPNKQLKMAMATLAMLCIEGTIAQWVANHRFHHRFSDTIHDIHTPTRSFLHAHFMWMFRNFQIDQRIYAGYLLRDQAMQKVSRYVWWITLISFLIQPMLGMICAGLLGESLFTGFFLGFIWGLVRIFFVHHVTWSINSLCHIWGTKKYNTGDNSRNLCWLSVPTLGESNHNTHHHQQSWARHGESIFDDPTYLMILIFERLGWVTDVRRPDTVCFGERFFAKIRVFKTPQKVLKAA